MSEQLNVVTKWTLGHILLDDDSKTSDTFHARKNVIQRLLC